MPEVAPATRPARRRIVATARGLTCAGGMLLAAAGQYRAAVSDRLSARISDALGAARHLARVLPRAYPGEVALGLALYLVGTLLIAFGLGRLPVRPPPARAVPADGWWRMPPRSPIVGPLAVTLVLVLASALLLWQPHPGGPAVIAWAATIVAGLLTAVILDRRRRTPFGNPFVHRREGWSLLLIVALDLALVGHDVGHWRWSGTPDEAYFFTLAAALVEGQARFPLSEAGVFGYHPVLSSYYQAAFLRLFGMDAFGWRLSSAVALAASLPGLYLLTRELWDRRVAYVAVALFAPAQLAVAFAHHGYNNVHVYLVVLPALGVLAWSIQRASVAGSFAAGGMAALGFYTFHPARFAPVLLLILGWSLRRRPARGNRAAWRLRCPSTVPWALAGFVVTALPVLLHLRQSFTSMLAQTALGGAQPPGSRLEQLWNGLLAGTWVGRVWDHWVISTLYAVWSKTDHFVGNPIADPISAMLAGAGLWLAAASLRRQAGSRFVLLAFLVSTLAIGATSPYPMPPLTRLLFFSPFTAMLAAVTLDQLLRRIEGVRGMARAAPPLAVVVVAAAVVWNIALTQFNIRVVNHGYGDGTTSELIRLVARLPDTCRILYVQRRETFMDSVDSVMAAHGARKRFTYLKPFGPRAVDELERIEPPAVIAYDLVNPDEITRLEAILEQRFPGREWQDTAPGKSWNVRYFYLPPDE